MNATVLETSSTRIHRLPPLRSPEAGPPEGADRDTAEQAPRQSTRTRAASLTTPGGRDKGLNEVGYLNVKEGESPELEAAVDPTGISYVASGAACEKFGVIKGKEGKLTTLAPVTIQGMAALPTRKIFVKEATALAPRKLTLENTNSHVFTFPNAATITCGGVVFTGTATAEESIGRAFTGLSFTNCTTTILAGNPAIKFEAVAGTGCFYNLVVFEGNLAVPQRAGNAIGPVGCVIRATVMTCVVEFQGIQLSNGIRLTNVAGPPKKITVKFSEGAALNEYSYVANANCGTVPARGDANYKGESKLKAEITSSGVAADIDVR
jgi:hypothetical protein